MVKGVRASIVLVLLLIAAACGTRLSDEAFAPTEEIITRSEGTGPVVTGPERAGSDEEDDDDVGGATGGQGGSTGGPAGPADDQTGSQPDGDAGPGGDGGRAPNRASDTGITEDTIRIGNITAEQGALGDTFAPAIRGLRAWVAHTNANGGIHGRRVELVSCDDREDRARTLECARRLVERDEVFALVATNTRSLGGASQYLADQGVPVLGFPINNAFYRYPNFFSVYGTGFARDGRFVGRDGQLVWLTGQYRWFKEQLGVDSAAVFFYDIAESSQAGKAFAEGLRLEGYSVKEFAVSFAAPSFDSAIAELDRDDVEVIFDAMDDGANRRLCDSIQRRSGYAPKAKVSTVVIMGETTGGNYGDDCRNVLYTANQSYSFSADVAPVREFREAYARYQPGLPLHQWALEAWAMGNIARDAIESMGPAPTRTGFIEFLNTMDPNTGGGIMIGTWFRPEQINLDSETNENCLAIARWLDSAGGWTMASDPFPVCYPDAKTYLTPAAEQGN